MKRNIVLSFVILSLLMSCSTSEDWSKLTPKESDYVGIMQNKNRYKNRYQGEHLTVEVNMDTAGRVEKGSERFYDGKGFHAGLGLNLHGATISSVNKLSSFGMGGELDLYYYFSANIGVNIGFGFDAHGYDYSLKNWIVRTPMVDPFGMNIVHINTFGNIEEKYQYGGLSIPIRLALYRKGFYLNAGAKINIPTQFKNEFCYQLDNSELEIAALGQTIPISHEKRMFEGNSNYKQLLGSWCALSLEFGYRFHGKDFKHYQHYFTLGVWLDYGLKKNNLFDGNQLITLDDALPPLVSYNEIGVAFMNNPLRFVNFGIKLSYDFEYGTKK